MAKRRVEHEAAAVPMAQTPVAAGDLAGFLLDRIRRFFGLLGGD